MRAPNPAIVIVGVDQKSEDVLGSWPFPRSVFAEALDTLREAGARVVVFDIIFPQPDPSSEFKAVYRIPRTYNSLRTSKLETPVLDGEIRSQKIAVANQKFADALSRSRNVILGYLFFLGRQVTGTQDSENTDMFLKYLSTRSAYKGILHPEYERSLFCEDCRATDVEPSLPKLAAYAKNFGFINMVADSDGVTRRGQVIMRFQDKYYPSLSVVAALAYAHQSDERLSAVFNPNGLERIELGALSVDTDPEGMVQIDYRGPAETYATYSFSDLVQHKVPTTIFSDKLVLIGATAPGIGDNKATPFDPTAFPGVEVHANLVDNLLTGHFIRHGLQENLVDIGFMLFLGFAPGVLLTLMSPVRATVLVIAFFGAFLWLTYYLFVYHLVWVSVLFPASSLAFSYGGLVTYCFLTGKQWDRH